MSITLDGTLGITAPTYAGTVTAEYSVPVTAFKNRIINGAMVIDQRYAGASVTPSNQAFVLDRWACYQNQASKYSVQQNAGSVTPPVGFSKYLGVTSLSSYSVLTGDYNALVQTIEGLNVSDLAWGTASAATVTLSFWVRSSLTGTFGGALKNDAGNYSYPFTYTISSANTWEQKSITITGPTSGTWLTTNGIGIYVQIGLGVGSTYSGTAGSWAGSNYVSATGATSLVGTNGATFYITGVQLEKGSTATSFDYRPYTTELALCQRYFFKYIAPVNTGAGVSSGVGVAINTTLADNVITAPVSMRVSGNNVTPTVNSMQIYVVSTGTAYSSGTWAIPYDTNNNEFILRYTHGSGVFTAGGTVLLVGNSTTGYVSLSAEL